MLNFLSYPMGQYLSTDPRERLAYAAPLRYRVQLTSILQSLFGDSEEHKGLLYISLFPSPQHMYIDKKEENLFDLVELPPELALSILSYLNPTELYLASCVWWNLASSESLWKA